MVDPLSIEEVTSLSSLTSGLSVRHRGTGSHEIPDEDLAALIDDESAKLPKESGAVASRQLTVCITISFIFAVILAVLGGNRKGKQTSTGRLVRGAPLLSSSTWCPCWW
jgi:hypothetical protein